MPSVCTEAGFPQGAMGPLISADDAHLESIESLATDEKEQMERLIGSADVSHIAHNRFVDGEDGKHH